MLTLMVIGLWLKNFYQYAEHYQRVLNEEFGFESKPLEITLMKKPLMISQVVLITSNHQEHKGLSTPKVTD